MKRKIIILFLFLVCPFVVNASSNESVVDEEYKLISSNEKYFKTTNVIKKSNTNILSNEINENDIILSYTTEITEEEYDNAEEESIQPYGSSNYVQTDYKKLTISILESGSAYKYKAVLNWRKTPAVRSSDIIAIGFYQSVKAISVNYQTDYCLTTGACSTIKSFVVKNTSKGAGAVFQLPTATNISSLKNTLTLDIAKNVSDATVIEQLAVADYAHAVKKISSTNANNYIIDTTGITHQGTASYFDTISSVSTSIKCNW